MERHTVLCYGDSNTWGANPVDISRFPYDVRWTGVFARELGDQWLVSEAGLGNRTTGFDDPLIPDRNGLASFPMVFEMHSPLDWVIVMLGTNDPKKRVGGNLEGSVAGVEGIARHALAAGTGVILVSPVPMRSPIKYDEFDDEFSVVHSESLAPEYRNLASTLGILFFEAGKVAVASEHDRVHLDPDAHLVLGQSLAQLLLESPCQHGSSRNSLKP